MLKTLAHQLGVIGVLVLNGPGVTVPVIVALQDDALLPRELGYVGGAKMGHLKPGNKWCCCPDARDPVRVRLWPAIASGVEVDQTNVLEMPHQLGDLPGQVKGVVAGVAVPRVRGHVHADRQCRVKEPCHVEVEQDDLELVPISGLWLGSGPDLVVGEGLEVLVPDSLSQPEGLGMVGPAMNV